MFYSSISTSCSRFIVFNVAGKKRKSTVVAPSAPKSEAGLYWGYATRLAANLSAVFTQSPYVGGYDLIIGTSEHGSSVDEFVLQKFKCVFCTYFHFFCFTRLCNKNMCT